MAGAPELETAVVAINKTKTTIRTHDKKTLRLRYARVTSFYGMHCRILREKRTSRDAEMFLILKVFLL